MKNYYKILEVNENASKEVIDKVYKILAKKYHPDLQKEENKIEYEQKFKQINEAYQILSDPEKRKQYDSEFKKEYVRRQDYEKVLKQNERLKLVLNNMQKDDETDDEKEQINQLPFWTKVRIYIKYYLKLLVLKHSNEIAFFLTFVVLVIIYRLGFFKYIFDKAI